MGILKKFGKKWCIVNTQNGVKGRCSKSKPKAQKMLNQAKCQAKKRRTGQKITCPLK